MNQAQLRHTEARRQNEQEQLDFLKSAAERNKIGQFATPPSLALDIVRYARTIWEKNPEPVRFLDPAIGTGSFYSALKQIFPIGSPVVATGVEIDPRFARTAASLWARDGLCVIEGDFTKLSPPPQPDRFNLVIANPPYVRHHHLNGASKERLRQNILRNLHLTISGLSGLYCYFLFLCHTWVAENGLSVWLIPSEFMSVNYGEAVRRYLTDKVTLLHIHRFSPSDIQFSDAFVSSAVVIFRKAAPPADHRVKFSFGGSLLKPLTMRDVPLSHLRSESKWTKYPAHDPAPSPTIWTDSQVTLGEFFSIKRGLATGANDFFILTADAVAQYGIPQEFLKPILPGPRYLVDPVIEPDADGYPAGMPKLALIDSDYAEDIIKRKFPPSTPT